MKTEYSQTHSLTAIMQSIPANFVDLVVNYTYTTYNAHNTVQKHVLDATKLSGTICFMDFDIIT